MSDSSVVVSGVSDSKGDEKEGRKMDKNQG